MHGTARFPDAALNRIQVRGKDHKAFRAVLDNRLQTPNIWWPRSRNDKVRGQVA